jgi:hypothetical protein
MAHTRLLRALALWIAWPACSSNGSGADDAGVDAAPDASQAEALLARLQSDGFDVQRGDFVPADLSDCCQAGQRCYGNNPASPYAGFRLPAGADQKVPNPLEDENDESLVWRLREDEAVVYVGRTPPDAGYFGYTPYVYDRDNGAGGRADVFASLSETLNQAVIAVDGASDPFDRDVALIAAGDQGVANRVRAALVDVGFAEGAINEVVLDPTAARFGLDEGADTFTVIFRVAFFEDAAAGAAFLKDPPGDVFRVTPDSPAGGDPFDAPLSRPKDTVATEDALAGAVDDLEAALLDQYSAYTPESLTVTNLAADPAVCLSSLTNCYGDNRDTIYPATAAQPMFPNGDEFYVVYGVNHQVSGKATYASATVHGLLHFVGLVTATSREYGGSADDELPGHPDAAQLYAWKFARDCGSDPHCTEVPDEMCPTGLLGGGLGLIVFRTYLEPGTDTAPDPSTLVTDRVLRFTP